MLLRVYIDENINTLHIDGIYVCVLNSRQYKCLYVYVS